MNKKLLLPFFLSFALLLMLAACGGEEVDVSEDELDNEDEAEAEDGGGAGGVIESDNPEEAQTLRISLGLNDQHPLYESAVHFGELLTEKTDDFNVEVYHSEQIAGDLVATEMLQNGDLEITIPSTSPLMNIMPEYGVFDLPFVIPDHEAADEVLDGPFGDQMLDMLEDQDLVGLAWWENGFRNLTNDIRPVESIDDLDGLTLRTMETDIHLDVWDALGANPTPMSMGEVFTGLQQGTIDGQENPYPTIDLEGFDEVNDYLSGTNHVYTPFVFLFSKPIWDELDEDQQEAIAESAYEAREFNRERTREVEESSLEDIQDRMEFSEITDEEYERFQEAVEPVIEDHSVTIGEDIVNDFMEAVEATQ
ncbi:tripartite ATP-independent transporter DctP family solute receptor [Geomicrobium halophilum]|uniref:Tripartite ATP-independent transporter DctP family solute receptor n=1 Tax=Geomicrobium halophilum TaxID=549000 RepID=A0A841PQQ6_9BACL|nr:TRAP transporter substrate-binding protein [Geomicrobium halophilum]MBB6448631.1 tripartite ATP-independent transporter DctP family solute receptor [Geomicrobium halophilum]